MKTENKIIIQMISVCIIGVWGLYLLLEEYLYFCGALSTWVVNGIIYKYRQYLKDYKDNKNNPFRHQ